MYLRVAEGGGWNYDIVSTLPKCMTNDKQMIYDIAVEEKSHYNLYVLSFLFTIWYIYRIYPVLKVKNALIHLFFLIFALY